MKTLFVLNEAPYGDERSYNGRGIVAEGLAEGAHRGSMEELTEWELWAERSLVF